MYKSILKIAGGAALAALGSASVLAGNGQAETSKLYASNAITNGEYSKAEKILQPASYTDARDPARLINLATVYIQTQRFDEAREALGQVRELPDEVLLLAGGVNYTSHNIARAMLKRLP